MENKPGISWGRYEPILLKSGQVLCGSCRINLLKSSKGWLAIYYDDPDSKGEIIRIFKPKNLFQYYKMKETVAVFNYNTKTICPFVKLQMDGTRFKFILKD
jgi:hypothetical protein